MIVIEHEGEHWGAYAPDLPGLGVAGASRAEVEALAAEAVHPHVELLKELGEAIPESTAEVTYVGVG